MLTRSEIGSGPSPADPLSRGISQTPTVVLGSLDKPTRTLVLRLIGGLGGPTEADFAALDAHPNSVTLATWLLRLPAYVSARGVRRRLTTAESPLHRTTGGGGAGKQL